MLLDLIAPTLGRLLGTAYVLEQTARHILTESKTNDEEETLSSDTSEKT